MHFVHIRIFGIAHTMLAVLLESRARTDSALAVQQKMQALFCTSQNLIVPLQTENKMN